MSFAEAHELDCALRSQHTLSWEQWLLPRSRCGRRSVDFAKILPIVIGLAVPVLITVSKYVIGKRTFPNLVDAINRGDAEAVKKLLTKGSVVNTKDELLGRTPLIMAAMGGHGEIVRILLDKGADVHQVDMEGWTAMRYAVAYGHGDIIKMLAEAGAPK